MSSPFDIPAPPSDVFVAPHTTLIGDVRLGPLSSVWFGAVLRADNDRIEIGSETNIQDNVVIHVDPGCPVHIGHACTIGHGAIVHGARLDQHVLVGMNAVLLNNAQVGAYCIIGAGALLTGGTVIPPRSLVLGSPAKVVRSLTEEECRSIERNAAVYVQKSKDYLQHFGPYRKNQ